MVGATLTWGFEEFDIGLLLEGCLEKGLERLRRAAFVHDEQTQAASLRTRPDSDLGKLFIAFVAI